MKKDIIFIVVFCLIASVLCNVVGYFLSQYIHLL
nr:MAG TPA: ATPase [Caudoviricetes sp.]